MLPMSSSAKLYDVFVSFSGVDVRDGFLSFLFDALDRKSIRVFIDCKLPRGKDIWPSLAKAIEESHVAIVVFSESYASSTWCLKELVKILECREDMAQVVILVFYNIDPSHVRKQIGIYEKAFAKHERDFGDKKSVLRWKSALIEAANISGWVSWAHRSEIHLVESIANDVLQKIRQLYPTELKGLVGTVENCKNVEKLLLKQEYRVIGIWGMGEIGTSTIAKIVFAKYFSQYDHVYFMSNSKEYSLDKFFASLFKEEVETSNVVGSTFDMKRLGGKKVFIVLDDVDMDSLDTIHCLFTEFGILHPDSRLIITTRDRQLLEGRVDVIYEIKEWKYPESLELFCLKAFVQSYLPKDYESLSDRAILGSHFCKKKIAFWKSTFRKLNRYPKKEIMNVLKVSYMGLDDLEKNIFLDIAYFFKVGWKDDVIRILDACSLEATSGIEGLAGKALITILDNNRKKKCMTCCNKWV